MAAAAGMGLGKLGEVLPLEYGKALPERLRDATGQFPVYGSSGRVGKHSSAIVTAPTIIVGQKGSAGAVFLSEEDCWPIDTAYFTKPKHPVDLRYAYYYFDWSKLDRLDQSTAIPSLSRDIYFEQSIPLPPLPEQRRIVARIDELFAEIAEGEAALERARSGLDTWRRALLKAAVTGELTRDWREAANARSTGAEFLERILGEGANNKRIRHRGHDSLAPYDTSLLPDLPQIWIWAPLTEFIDRIEAGLNVRPPDLKDFATTPVRRSSAVRFPETGFGWR